MVHHLFSFHFHFWRSLTIHLANISFISCLVQFYFYHSPNWICWLCPHAYRHSVSQATYDPFPQFPILRAQLWADLEIIRPQQVSSHFACLPMSDDQQNIAILSLSHVSLINLSHIFLLYLFKPRNFHRNLLRACQPTYNIHLIFACRLSIELFLFIHVLKAHMPKWWLLSGIDCIFILMPKSAASYIVYRALIMSWGTNWVCKGFSFVQNNKSLEWF